MPDELAQAKAELAVFEKQAEELINKGDPKLIAEYRINRAGGKSVADSINEAQKSTGLRLKTPEDEQALNATRAVIANNSKNLPPNSKEKKTYQKLLQGLDKSAGDLTNSMGKMSYEATELVGRVRAVSDLYRQNIQTASANATNSIYGFGNTVIGALSGATLIPDEISKPISSALGSSVNTATAIVRNPLGAPFIIANSMVSIIDKISPGFANKLDSEFKAVNLTNLQNLPSKMMGSVKHLAFALDALLSVPFEIMSDLYNGLLDMMEAIADVIDGIVSAAIQMILNQIIYAILDSVLLEEIMTFLNEVGELASFVGDIANLAGGFSMITDITSQVTSFSDSFSNALTNPLQLASSYFPQIQQGFGFVDQITDTLRDPEKLLDQYLPPQIGEQMKKISQLPGLGFVGDKGYSVGGVLDTLSEGVFTKAINKFSNRSPMLNGLFNKRPEPTESDFAQEPHKDGYEDGEYKPGSTVHSGGAEAVASTSKVLPEKASTIEDSFEEQSRLSEQTKGMIQQDSLRAQSEYANQGKFVMSYETQQAAQDSKVFDQPPVIKTGVVAQGTTADGQRFTVTAPEGSPFLPNR